MHQEYYSLQLQLRYMVQGRSDRKCLFVLLIHAVSIKRSLKVRRLSDIRKSLLKELHTYITDNFNSDNLPAEFSQYFTICIDMIECKLYRKEKTIEKEVKK